VEESNEMKKIIGQTVLGLSILEGNDSNLEIVATVKVDYSDNTSDITTYTSGKTGVRAVSACSGKNVSSYVSDQEYCLHQFMQKHCNHHIVFDYRREGG
jgi:hypothetical protein